MDPLVCWVVSDGKAGDEQPCIGIAEAMGLAPMTRHVSPRPPFSWAMPWGPIDPREAPRVPGSPLAPPFPDLAIASGRRAVAYLRRIKRDSAGRTFTVFLKDPRTGTGAADLIWVAEHDRLRGRNVIVSATAPHRLSADRLAAARAHPDPRLAVLPSPRAAVLVGGDSHHHRFTESDIERLLRGLRDLAASGVALTMTVSRRTPARLRERLVELSEETDAFLWDGSGDNPYAAMLALADAVVVTADSSNMIGEAAASGRPVLVFEPSGGHAKLSAFVADLERQGVVHPFRGRLEGAMYEPVDSTPRLAQAIASALGRHRQALGLS